MLVHSFSDSNEGFTDYRRFLSLFSITGELDRVVSVGYVSGVYLYFAWVCGDKQYRKR
ncbi:MAG: hypothetical protein JETT_1648 [Candidatus Jettenia ecosi]|uniref:DUF6946 domain-containing protein n=1 Tax=Candidatus Jettenia ecosi TaxID=2494326 RepID=A0A533QNB7_9BACT|nr:MAG: hypothetical protein JETT_1648 [Candidatus Jettenia ecosi]